MADSQNKKTDMQPVEAKQQEARPESQKPATPKKPADVARKSLLPAFTLVLVLLVALAGVAGGYYLWQQQQNLMGQQQNDTSQLMQLFKQQQQQLGNINQSIQSNKALIQQLETSQQQINAISQRAIELSNRGDRAWLLAEVDYLLRLADRRLQIARDINSAIAALQGADERIHELGDLNLLPIRKQLAKDIAELKSLHQVDVNGIALALDQMINHVGDLPFKSVQDEIKTQVEEQAKQPVEDKPQGFVDSVISTVKNIGDIKIHHRSIQPASSAQQQQQIEEILVSHLLGARLAVLRYDQLQFAHDIEQAQILLHLHYNNTDNRVSQMNSDLSRYTSINLTPDLPVITGAWNMLQKTSKASAGENKPAATPAKPAVAPAPATAPAPTPATEDKKPAEVL